MDKYIPNKTQEERILDLLKERGELGAYAWEFTGQLRIMQYNARVFGLRKKGYNILNQDKCHFVLKQFNTEPTGQESFL